ncbi:MAG: hypothetical protein IM638_10740 [Bacteroidetes bacterium]|nr:hypothetical protein [Bacteroidota bacterium]
MGFFNPSNLLRDVVTPLFVGEHDPYSVNFLNKNETKNGLTQKGKKKDAEVLARIFVAHYIKSILWEAQQCENVSDIANDLLKKININYLKSVGKNVKISKENYFISLTNDEIEKAYQLFKKGQLIPGFGREK